MRSEIVIHETAILELHQDANLREAMHWHARRIAVYAKRSAPYFTGEYRRSIEARRSQYPGATAVVVSTDDKAMLMEHGSKHNEAFHTLRNASRRAGYRTVGVVE